MQEKEVLLSKFVVGQVNFESHGISSIYVREKDETTRYDLPVKSIGIVELQDELEKYQPKPPVRLLSVKKESELGRSLELSEDTPVKILDTADKEYRKELKEYQQDFMWRTILNALDIEFVDESGSVITDFTIKKEALQKSGITGHHLDTIFSDIQGLTAKRETQADFLSGNRLG